MPCRQGAVDALTTPWAEERLGLVEWSLLPGCLRVEFLEAVDGTTVTNERLEELGAQQMPDYYDAESGKH